MRLGIRTKLFFTAFTLVLIVVVVTGLVLSYFLKSDLLARIENELVRHAKSAKALIEIAPLADDISSADPLADEFGGIISARVTIILEDGRVIGDSELERAQIQKIENHADRVEVRHALTEGLGKSRRFSMTVGHDMLYVAVKYERRSSRGVVRVSKPLSEVSEAVSQLRRLMAIAGLIGLLMAIFISVLSSHFLSRTLRTLVDFARRTAEGKRPEPIKVTSPYAFEGLAGSLNTLSRRIEQHVTDLAKERDRFEAVLEGMNEAVLAIDDRQRVNLINRAGIMLLGLTGQPIGKTLIETIRVPALHDLITSVEQGNESTVEFDLPGDTDRKILARSRRQQTGGTVLVLLDVTELRRLETVRRDFVSNVSHELRTPVSIIRANAETLANGALDDREAAKRFVGSILDNAERLSNLIADLLDISKIEEGKYDLDIEPVTVGPSLRRAAAALSTGAIEKRFSIQVEPADDLRVSADVKALDQILFNLVDNAVKYAEHDGRVVLRAVAAGDEIKIEVEDNGPGIAPEHRGRLFERFFRVDKGRSREMGGTGLGLAIVKHLVTAMGGNVGAAPAQPRGSIFWFTLPLFTGTDTRVEMR